MPLDASGDSRNLHLNADPFRCCVCGDYTLRHLCKRCATDPRLADPANPAKVHPAVIALQNDAATAASRDRAEKQNDRNRADPARQANRRKQWAAGAKKYRQRRKASTTNI